MAKELNEIIPESFTAKVHGMDFKLENIRDLPLASLRKIFEYGAQRIMNDSTASGKDDAERLSLANKRWDNLKAGVIRSSGTRIGDPVKRRAMELAMNAVASAPKFKAWLVAAELKASDKQAVAQQRAQAEKYLTNYMAQAKIDVDAQKALPSLDLEDLEID